MKAKKLFIGKRRKGQLQGMKSLVLGCYLLIAAIIPAALNGQAADSISHPKSVIDQLLQEKVVRLRIETDWPTLVEDRSKDERQAARIQYKIAGAEVAWSAEVRLRGGFRRTFCEFPPLAIHLPKAELKAAGLAPWNKLKLVTHCYADPDLSKDLLLREFLLYRMYNVLSPESFRVQLALITYVNSERPSQKLLRWGFVIEHSDELATRLGKAEQSTYLVSKAEVERNRLLLLRTFQSMIGNTDWDLDPVRNLKIFGEAGNRSLVPYDFDFAKLVEAPYAKAKDKAMEALLIAELGACSDCSPQEKKEISLLFREKRKPLQQVIKECKWLPIEQQQELSKQIDEFITRLNYSK